jgi:hypothetical protein
MASPPSRSLACSVAALISVAVLVVLAFLLAGPSYVGDLLSNSLWYLLGISVIAGVVRFPFRRGGLALSVACGTIVAISGFFLILGFAASRI